MDSAYSLEDNELWKRHAVTLVSQVTVAFYVFCRWWSGEKRLLASAVLLFVVGFLRFAQKPWALRTASFNSFQASSTVPVPRAQREEEPLHEYIYTLEEYVQAAKKCALGTKVERKNEYEITSNYMFVDRSAPYSIRIEGLTSFLKLEYKYAYKTLKCCLGDTFRSLYTRIESIVTIPGVCSVLLLPFLALASMVLFATSSKNGQNKNDIRVTYILFCCTTVLELLLPSMTVPCCHSLFFEHLPCGWHDMVSQHNIMSFCVRKKNPTFMMKLVTFNFLRELVNQHRYVQQVPIAYQITGTVRRHIEDGWKKYIHDAASYRRFSELRGQWALRMHHQLGWSLNMAFDESVLIWHVATELCFYHPNTSSQCRQGEATQHGREISNYMFYLLLIRPEMLMPGTRSDLFTMVSDKIVENSNGPLELTEEILAQEILNMSMLPFAIDMVSKAHKL
uniref:DUF4220 domain-containing protein n=1 Tax=Triticum urartu TaxID=4572 RepID=A0A8R7UM29_TRIUA